MKLALFILIWIILTVGAFIGGVYADRAVDPLWSGYLTDDFQIEWFKNELLNPENDLVKYKRISSDTAYFEVWTDQFIFGENGGP